MCVARDPPILSSSLSHSPPRPSLFKKIKKSIWMGDSFFGFDTNLPPDPTSSTAPTSPQRAHHSSQAPAGRQGVGGPGTGGGGGSSGARVLAPPPGLGHLGPAPGHPAFRDPPVRRSNNPHSSQGHHGHHYHHHAHHPGRRGGLLDDEMEDARNDETFGAVDSTALGTCNPPSPPSLLPTSLSFSSTSASQTISLSSNPPPSDSSFSFPLYGLSRRRI